MYTHLVRIKFKYCLCGVKKTNECLTEKSIRNKIQQVICLNQ